MGNIKYSEFRIFSRNFKFFLLVRNFKIPFSILIPVCGTLAEVCLENIIEEARIFQSSVAEVSLFFLFFFFFLVFCFCFVLDLSFLTT